MHPRKGLQYCHRPSVGLGSPRHCIPPERTARILLPLPALQRPMKIPGTGFEIRFWIKQFLCAKIRDTRFLRPFLGRNLTHLHQPSLAGAAHFLRIEFALAPDHRLQQHRIELIRRRDRADQPIVLLKPLGTEPFMNGVNWFA